MRYYILQLLREKLNGQLTLWTRWGRLGDRGQNQKTPFQHNEAEALKEFKKVLKQKAAVLWDQLCEAPDQAPPYVQGKYRIVQLGSRNCDKSIASSYQTISRVMNINTIVKNLEDDLQSPALSDIKEENTILKNAVLDVIGKYFSFTTQNH